MGAINRMEELLERRSRGVDPEQQRVEDLWKTSELAHREEVRLENRDRWRAFHIEQAERLRRTMTRLVEAHEAKAEKLLQKEEF